ncbi:MAG: 4Fe-4S double cluster binding domain-containing protein [Candidatus Thorarchaeota archaeon]
MQSFIEKLLCSGNLSNNDTYHEYLNELSFRIPDSMPDAKSVIIMAVSTPLAVVNFHYRENAYKVFIPPQYYKLGITQEQLKSIITDTIIQDKGFSLDYANSYLFLKHIATASGLAKYGRNNICYVDGMGSMLSLHAFLTNYEFRDDYYSEPQLMDRCSSCKVCLKQCPTGAIREESFAVDVGRCITLYNEVDCQFPEWMSPDVHNSLMGCMKCQYACPVNRESIENTLQLEDVSHYETESILRGAPSEELLESLSRKLRGFYPATFSSHFPILTRNLRQLIPI